MTKEYTKDLHALGRRTPIPGQPDRATLETFPNPAPQSDYTVRLDCLEFTSMCPLTGQPDFGRFSLEYAPLAHCLESKSLKLYLASFRSEGAFWEDLSNRIADDVFAVLSPRWLTLRGEMAVRGGIAISTTVRRGDFSGASAALL